MKQILLIEDNREISESIREYLEMEGFGIEQAFDGEKGIEKATEKSYDLILLDLMLPEVDGISIARRVREKKWTPIMMITARESLQDRLLGFDVGAVDYLVKPFDLWELLARIKVHLWKTWQNADVSSPGKQEDMKICGIYIDIKRHSFIKNGEEIHLTQKEFLILEKLLENKQRVVERSEIIEYLWGEDSLFEGGDNKLDVYISNIRSKLAKGMIITVKGVGYKIGFCESLR
jgi:two-component system response regulator ArlR